MNFNLNTATTKQKKIMMYLYTLKTSKRPENGWNTDIKERIKAAFGGHDEVIICWKLRNTECCIFLQENEAREENIHVQPLP